MKGVKAKKLAKKTKALTKMRAAVGWTRAEWITTATEKLRQAAVMFFKARLAENNGPRRFAKGWRMEFERVLSEGTLYLFVQPVKRKFEMGDAFEEAVREVEGTPSLLRVLVQREFIKGVGPVRRPLTEADDAAFWKLVRDEARILKG